MNTKEIAGRTLSLIRSLILQDLFWGYRQTGKVPRYTVVKITEELFIILLLTISLVVINKFNGLSSLLLSLGIVHVMYALFSPPLYNSLGVKNKLKPVPRKEALKVLAKMLLKVNKYLNKVYVTGSICYAEQVRDVDATIVPVSYFSAYVLFIHLRIWIFKFITRRIRFFPDIYILEYNIYSYTCEPEIMK
ncbi:MAG: hypothetical protein QXJ64_07760 [Thermosphaera sp.]